MGRVRYTQFKIKNQKLKSQRLSPTTTNPMTPPAPNATLSALLRLVRAALVVLAEEFVAWVIPIKPEIAEKKPPLMNMNGTKIGSILFNARTRRMTKTAAKIIVTTLYCRLR